MKNLKHVATSVALALVMLVSFSVNAQQLSNEKNPYDTAGAQHNEVVKEFIKRYGASNLSVEESLSKTHDICKEKGIEGRALSAEEFYSGMNDIKNNFAETVNSSRLSSNGKSELQRLFTYMVSSGFEGGVSLSECVEFILKFEDDIIESNTLSQSDKEFLLKSSSVGRYSVNFWHDYYEGANGNTNDLMYKPALRWVRWLIVGAADIAGGVAGGGPFSVATGAAASTTTIAVIDKAK